MDDGKLDCSSQQFFSSPDMDEFQFQQLSDSPMDNILDELLQDTLACIHTHTCNHPGPGNSHTHSCFHVHTKLVSSPTEEKIVADETTESVDRKATKRPLGNKAAVRKYREKKKTLTGYLEDEIVRLRALNRHLLKRLQDQAALEAEIARLKCLLVDIRGRIEGEIGCFAYQKSINPMTLAIQNISNSYVMNPCNLHCEEQTCCLHADADGNNGEVVPLKDQSFSRCELRSLPCLSNQNSGPEELPGCEL